MILWRFFALIVKKRHFHDTRLIFTLQVVDIYLLSEHTPAQTFQLKGVTTLQMTNLFNEGLHRPFS